MALAYLLSALAMALALVALFTAASAQIRIARQGDELAQATRAQLLDALADRDRSIQALQEQLRTVTRRIDGLEAKRTKDADILALLDKLGATARQPDPPSQANPAPAAPAAAPGTAPPARPPAGRSVA